MICSLLLLGAGSHLLAQKPAEHSYLLELSGMNGRPEEKVVLSAIDDQAPGAFTSVDLAAQMVKIRCSVILDRVTLEQRLAPWNILVVRLEPLASAPVLERSPGSALLPGFPVRMNTGDPAADEADYRLRKEQWIAAHPDLYPPPQPHAQPR